MSNKYPTLRSSGVIWRIMRRLNPLLSRRFRSGGKPSELVLVLSTIGRKTGKVHKTPLQYEIVNGDYYIASARGPKADWFCNILSNPEVIVSIGGREFPVRAEPITNPKEIADFLELKQRRNPWMIKLLLRLEGLRLNHTREELEEFALQKAVVVLHPLT